MAQFCFRCGAALPPAARLCRGCDWPVPPGGFYVVRRPWVPGDIVAFPVHAEVVEGPFASREQAKLAARTGRGGGPWRVVVADDPAEARRCANFAWPNLYPELAVPSGLLAGLTVGVTLAHCLRPALGPGWSWLTPGIAVGPLVVVWLTGRYAARRWGLGG